MSKFAFIMRFIIITLHHPGGSVRAEARAHCKGISLEAKPRLYFYGAIGMIAVQKEMIVTTVANNTLVTIAT